jgi:hypothetical protein
MKKLTITVLASAALALMLGTSAFAAPLAGVSSGIRVTAAFGCGCQKSSCCEKKSCGCEQKCCKPKCCEPKCCEPCCKKKCCCPAIPEYPMVCAHNHEDLQRDLASRQHAAWQDTTPHH